MSTELDYPSIKFLQPPVYFAISKLTGAVVYTNLESLRIHLFFLFFFLDSLISSRIFQSNLPLVAKLKV